MGAETSTIDRADRYPHTSRETNAGMHAATATPDHRLGMSLGLAPDTVAALRDEALDVARAAGVAIVDVYGENGSGVDGLEIDLKSDRTPVTEADMAAHALIVEELGALEPHLPVLSEESGVVPFAERRGWSAYWLVDPLDGTREFLRKNGEFTVNIALVQDHRPVLGVIVAPVLDLAYHAVAGGGAWKAVGGADPVPIHVRDAPRSGVTVARSRCPTTGPRMQRFLDALGTHDEIPMGASLKSCLVAEGAADVYARLGPTGEWDTAAAQVIVEEAGGRFIDTGRRELRYNTRESLINPDFVVYGDDSVDWVERLGPARVEAL